jgi:hypothetical protein
MESDRVVWEVMIVFRNVLGGVIGLTEAINQECPGGAPSIWDLDPRAASDKIKLRNPRGKEMFYIEKGRGRVNVRHNRRC